MTTNKLNKYYVNETIYLNWQCDARDEKHARELYEEHMSIRKNCIEEFQCAFENKWEDEISVEEVFDNEGLSE